MIPGRRQTAEEIELEIKKLQDRQEKFQA